MKKQKAKSNKPLKRFRFWQKLSNRNRAIFVSLLVAVIGTIYLYAAHATTAPKVAIAGNGTTNGYWTVGSDGSVYYQGSVNLYGTLYGKSLNAPIVNMYSTADGKGYYLVGSDGGVFAFGDAHYYGSVPGSLGASNPYGPGKAKHIVAIVSTPSNGGYWLVGSDGGVFAYGNAPFKGSAGNVHLAAPIVGMDRSVSGNGYWLVGSDGGVFAYGDAPFKGSRAGTHLAAPIVHIARDGNTNNYYLVGGDGGIFAYGAPYYGSLANVHLAAPISGMTTTPDGHGYWLVGQDGGIFNFGNAQFEGSNAVPPPTATSSTTQSYNSAGTYADWWWPSSGYQNLEWTVVPVQNPASSLAAEGLLHYYAMEFWVMNANNSVGGGYAGFQTNGIFNGVQEGEAINFSIWGSIGGNSPSCLVNPNNSESGGYQIMCKYTWTTGHQYRFNLAPGPTASTSSGNWWGLWVSDTTANTSTYVGEEEVPATIGGLSSNGLQGVTSGFGEDTHWWFASTGEVKYVCSDFQNSAMVMANLRMNQTVPSSSFTTSTNSGQTVTGSNGYKTVSCNVTNYSDSVDHDVQMNLGYWASQAPNTLGNY